MHEDDYVPPPPTFLRDTLAGIRKDWDALAPTIGPVTFEEARELPTLLPGYAFDIDQGNGLVTTHTARRKYDHTEAELRSAAVASSRMREFDLCGAITQRTLAVCTEPEDHDDVHIARYLNAHMDPSGKEIDRWAQLVGL